MKKNYLFVIMTLLFNVAIAQNQGGNSPNNTKVKTNSTLKKPQTTPSSNLKKEPKNETKHSGFGDHTCKTTELTQKYYESQGLWEQFNTDYNNSTSNVEVPNTVKTPGVNTISVIFHVVHNTNNPAENVSNALIMQVFNDISEDFQLLNANAANARTGFGFNPADANINFCLATQTAAGVPLTEVGVIRVATSEEWYDSDNGEENKMKASATGGSQIWDRNKYLNVWICDISNGAGSGTAGYAYRPSGGFLPSSSIDGIVLDYNLGMNNENVLTHEIGHYLGLDHTWGGSGSCTNDDGFGDTPNTIGPSFNYPGSCSGSQTTCSGIQTQYENYMDYSNCTVMYTQNQADFMLSILSGIRSSLLLSPGCNPVNAPPIANFNADIGTPIIIPVGGSVNFFDLSSNAPTAWVWNFGGGAANQTVQNPTVLFNSLGTFTVTLTASNGFGSDGEIKVGYVQVVAAASGTACDTLRNYNPVTENLTAYITKFAGWNDWGYFPGTGAYDTPPLYNTTMWADRYTAPTTTQVRRLIFPILQVDNNSGTGIMKIRVHSETAGSPGTVLTTDTLTLANMVEGSYNTFDFTTPPTVTGAFWVTFELFYGAPQDTVVLSCVNFDYRNGTIATAPNTMKLKNNNVWNTPAALYGASWKSSLWLDVLTSNGPAPIADFSLSEAQICAGGQINVNGSLSTNTTFYDWYLTNTVPTVISNSNTISNTYTIPAAGNYRIYLFADGSCKTDGIYVPIVVNALPAATVNFTNTTCGNNNGSITISSPTGGNSPNYTYSIDGTTYQTGTSFINLASGSYTVSIKTSGSNCLRTYPITINPSTPFVAGVSANTATCPGSTVSISASGGILYQWMDGTTPLGTSAMISVTPATTTQYSCLVTDGSGCQSTVYTTVTISPLDNANFTFNDFCFGSPNNATAIATAGGVFSFNPAPGDGATINSINGEITNGVLSTTYSVQYALNVNCPNTNIETVTVNTNDNATFTSTNWCVGNSHTVSGIVTPGGTFAFNPIPGDGATINTSTGVISNAVAGNSYTIGYTTPASVCQSSSTVSVTYNALPTVNGGIDQIVCQGTSVILTGSNATTYSWNNGVVNSSPFFPAVGTVTYTLTGTMNGCTNTDQVIVTVNPIPTVNAGADQVLCNDGTQVTLTASGTGTTYSWNNGVTDGVAFAPTTGTTAYTVTGTTSGCTATDMVTVAVNTIPTVNAGADQVLCDDGSLVTLTASGTGTSYSWNNGVTNTVAFVPTVGTITYTATGTSNGCTATDDLIVTVNALPTVTLASFTTVCEYWNPINLTGGSPAGGTYAGTNVSSNVFDPVAAGLGVTTITYTYMDANNCTNTATSDITVDACLSIDENNANGIKIYPNPVTNALNIEMEGDFSVTVLDARGRIVAESSASNSLTLNTTQFETGVYFVQVNNGNSTVLTTRIVKQ